MLIGVAVSLAGCSGSRLPDSVGGTSPLPVDVPIAPARGELMLPDGLQRVSYESLPGWRTDALEEAWPAWLRSCDALQREPRWTATCRVAARVPAEREAIRHYFEKHFVPLQRTQVRSGLLTSYYEPVVRGSRIPIGEYQWPLYRTPSDLVTLPPSKAPEALRATEGRGRRLPDGSLVPYPSRGELLQTGHLDGLEIVYLNDPVEAFFLQIQGSGRVQLPDGSSMRVAFAGKNGHPYRSIGSWLIQAGELRAGEASMQGIQAWIRANPNRRDEVFAQNPSMVFFRELRTLAEGDGPIGALGVPLTEARSIAVDTRQTPLGMPVLMRVLPPGLETVSGQRWGAEERLVFAQDRGSAIVGPHRTDFFMGSGDRAGMLAGRLKGRVELIELWPVSDLQTRP